MIIKIYHSLQDDATMGSTADLEFNINKIDRKSNILLLYFSLHLHLSSSSFCCSSSSLSPLYSLAFLVNSG